MTAASHVEQRVVASPPVIDYEGSPYQTAFWVNQDRSYEDATERVALQRLLPRHGGRIVELGAGFGRLAELYQGYEQVVLFDYSRTLLQEAVQRWGDDSRFVFVAGNLYQLPLASHLFDSVVMVRVMHHLAAVPQALGQIYRIMHRHSVAVLEYANKRHLKALLRWLLRRQSWSPLTLAPLEFVELNFDFHPAWMRKRLVEAQFQIREQWAVSHFRLEQLKRRVNPVWLAYADSLLYRWGGYYPLAPSVFLRALTPASHERRAVATVTTNLVELFRCPACNAEAFELGASKQLSCHNCGKKYVQKNGVWDFKESL